jgi:hypothetical protein
MPSYLKEHGKSVTKVRGRIQQQQKGVTITASQTSW